MRPPALHSTTVLAVRKGGLTAMGADGQVTLGQTVVKADACKLRRLSEGRVLVGFAGASGDAFALLERFEEELRRHNDRLLRAATELARSWRTDRVLRRLESMLLASDGERLLILSGSGDVIEPEEGVAGIGSGGAYATAAARALLRHTALAPRAVVEASLGIAAELCIYTNAHLTVEEVGG